MSKEKADEPVTFRERCPYFPAGVRRRSEERERPWQTENLLVWSFRDGFANSYLRYRLVYNKLERTFQATQDQHEMDRVILPPAAADILKSMLTSEEIAEAVTSSITRPQIPDSIDETEMPF